MAYRPFIIDTSDERCSYLASSLEAKGFQVQPMEDASPGQVGILVLPPQNTIDVNSISLLGRGSAVFGGKAEMDAKKMMSQQNISYFNILLDERFTVKNTIPTALGCIRLIMENRPECINELKVLVLGYGRVAKTLTKYLLALDTKTYIYTVDQTEKALSEVMSTGAEASLENAGKYQLIINTVPARLITPQIAGNISKSALVLDLASGDFVDIGQLESLGISAIKAPGLPGKAAPKSAARYMEECILDTLNRNTNLRSLFLIQ